MSLSVFNNSSSLNSLNLIPSFLPLNNSSSVCELTAWIHPRHGFVDFNCGRMKGAYGFYPGKAQEFNKEAEEVMIMGGGKKKMKGTLLVNSGTLYFSSAAHIQKRLARERVANQWDPKPVIFKASSLDQGINALMSGVAYYIKGKFKFEFRNFKNEECGSAGAVMEDSEYKIICQPLPAGFSSGPNWSPDACIYSTLETSEKNVKKAFDYVRKVQKIASRTMPKEEGKGLAGNYNALSYNCIDFVRETMRRADPSLNWEKKLEYTYEPSFFQKINSLAWHYFYWRKGT